MKQLITILLQNANLEIRKIDSIESINYEDVKMSTATTSSVSNTIFDTAVDDTSYCSCSIKSTIFNDDQTVTAGTSEDSC